MGTVRQLLQQKGHKILSISPKATVFSALEMMVEKDIGALVVMEDDKFLGMFTERDYARKVILKGRASKETPIKEIMSEHPAVVNLDTTIDECMQLMTDRYIRHLPVMENGKLIGIISIGDLVKFIVDDQKFIIDNLEHYIAG